MLEVGKSYNICKNEGIIYIKQGLKWQYCGQNDLGHLFQRFNVDYHIPLNEIDLFTFYTEPTNYV